MDKILEKFDVYDLLVRLFTGITVLTCAEFFGIIDILHPLSNDKTQLFYYLLIGGYFVGIVLEELLYVFSLLIKLLLNKISEFKLKRTNAKTTDAGTTTKSTESCTTTGSTKDETTTGSTKDEPNAESTKKGNLLIRSLVAFVALITLTPEEENKRLELISAGYEYLLDAPLYQLVMSGSYFLAFIGFLILGAIYRNLGYSLTQPSPFPDPLNCIVLGGLPCIFLFRYFHYCHRRKKLVNRYYEAYIVLKENKTQQQEPAESK